MTREERIPIQFPPQHQSVQPGLEWVMEPRPIAEDASYRKAGKLTGKTAIISGGDSGIGRAVAILFAKEGANVVIAYLNEHRDAFETKQRIEQLGQRCLTIAGDLGYEDVCRQVVSKTVETFGKVDIIVNNCAEAHPRDQLEEISAHQLIRTFQTNVFSYFYLTKAALRFLDEGSAVINTASEVAFEGQRNVLDYGATKGAIISFTKSLALNLVDRGIRVNGVSPGPVWTPLIPSSYPASDMLTFGYGTPMKRAAQPFELAPAYVYLASNDSRYVTGETIHVSGGMIAGC
ncbi:SDR family oxidoreductase [Desertibacillus haloalkaliphilus]|uniref:SDR family oxidoreductase n=1 Tax=Desertibacillus haloalkaliphilus TaxID=1328930 RepID=UPI001C25581D|nr:SDR family oxidoreductase [Desertibacillus haloalkaliphilus]MBU8905811.1 SDR family oxidoreductase [Desertibacillus haloalkaliphilus]